MAANAGKWKEKMGRRKGSITINNVARQCHCDTCLSVITALIALAPFLSWP
jgi:hypothetical protein